MGPWCLLELGYSAGAGLSPGGVDETHLIGDESGNKEASSQT